MAGLSRSGIGELRRILVSRAPDRASSPAAHAARAAEKCELCAAPIAAEHQHLVDLDTRSLLCVCRPCQLLFCSDGAGGRRYRAVPQRYLRSDALRISEAQWDALQVPISIAFFFWNSEADKMVAFYPSPAGATESLLPLEAWLRIADENPLLREVAPDVEAILVRRHEQEFEAFIVPIDSCYELVGRLRRTWKGFAGGDEAWAEIEGFFAGLVERSVVTARATEHPVASASLATPAPHSASQREAG